MNTVAKCAAIASVVLLTAGSAAWAQNNGTNPGNFGNQGYNQSYSQGNQGANGGNWGNPGYQGANSGNWGNQGANGSNWGNQGSRGEGMQGSSGQYSENSGAGSGSNNMSYGFAQRELAQYGYSDVHNLRPTQGWSADAMKNGRMVHVLLGEHGLVSTFRGE